jgi:NADH:ubiquinone oxidoreductase subunit F (NADH-binding)
MEKVLLTSESGPESFATYQEQGGYGAWRRAVTEGSGEAVLAAVSASGLRGRGGAAFPVGRKWQFAAEAPGEQKYVVCNGGEDEPGSRKDRYLMENYPHKVLEGVLLASYAIGAREAYLYVNREYAEAHASLQRALAEAEGAGFLGDRLFGSEYGITVRLHQAETTYVAARTRPRWRAWRGRRRCPDRSRPIRPPTGCTTCRRW